jgi:hypothetical protein
MLRMNEPEGVDEYIHTTEYVDIYIIWMRIMIKRHEGAKGGGREMRKRMFPAL